MQEIMQIIEDNNTHKAEGQEVEEAGTLINI
jgi:hypothetical protein